MIYSDPIQRLLSDDAFARYAMSTDGNRQSLSNLQALGTDSIFVPPNGAKTPGNPAGNTAGDLESHAKLISANPREQMAAACISGLWLLHNHLDPSHDISQSIDSPAGSHWHAIMHRLEGDFSNSKYWYRRVGRWPVYDQVAEITGQPFDPFAFVDQVQSLGNDVTHQSAVAEWRALFGYCYGQANA